MIPRPEGTKNEFMQKKLVRHIVIKMQRLKSEDLAHNGLNFWAETINLMRFFEKESGRSNVTQYPPKSPLPPDNVPCSQAPTGHFHPKSSKGSLPDFPSKPFMKNLQIGACHLGPC